MRRKKLDDIIIINIMPRTQEDIDKILSTIRDALKEFSDIVELDNIDSDDSSWVIDGG